ncbi:MAG: MFS transporter [Actinomycetota bacterium]|nr:MFS transporter [Actinomycetota bacterium]
MAEPVPAPPPAPFAAGDGAAPPDPPMATVPPGIPVPTDAAVPTGVTAPVGPDGGSPGPAMGAGVADRPVRAVLALASCRWYWLAQFLAALGNGALRFVFVWLALDVSDDPSAPGLLGMALGVPALVLMIPAGAWSDRFDRRRLVVAAELAAAAGLVFAAAVTWAGAMSVPVAAVFAALIGGLLAVSAPALQALVPSLVPPERIMTGAALQGMGMNAALLFGAVAGGGAIAVAGVGGAFTLLGVLQLVAAGAMARVRLAPHVPRARRPMRGDIGEGLRFALGHEPIRSLLGVGLLAGFIWGIVSILLPEVAKDDLGVGAFPTSLLFSALGVGLLCTSMTLASRPAIGRPGLLIAIAISTLLPGGVLAMGLSRSYALTLVVMVVWGVGGGISMTLQRGLLQIHTPDEILGRVMGLNGLAMLGSFPLAAAVASASASAVGAATSLVIVGLGAVAVSTPLVWRRAIRAA